MGREDQEDQSEMEIDLSLKLDPKEDQSKEEEHQQVESHDHNQVQKVLQDVQDNREEGEHVGKDSSLSISLQENSKTEEVCTLTTLFKSFSL